MRSERDIGHIGTPLPGNLHQHGGVADIGVGHRHTEPDVAAAPPPAGAHQDELTLGQDLVQRADGAPDPQHGVAGRQLFVIARIDEHHILDVGALRHLDIAVG